MAGTKSYYLKAKTQDERERDLANHYAFLADAGLTIAHELVHCFIGFLAGDRSVGTPKTMVPKGFVDDPERGESGRTWENWLLGGCASLSLPQEKGNNIPRGQIWIEKDYMEIEVHPEAIRSLVARSTLADAKHFGTCRD